MNRLELVMACECAAAHEPKTIVLTGGPGAGKTAVLELIRQAFCEHVVVLPEAAGVLFGGGFPRASDEIRRRAAQRAIYYVQRELEAAAMAAHPAIVLCDRGTIDGAAYWPGPGDMWPDVGTTLADEIRRYDAVIHLRTPPAASYNRDNPLRLESAAEALEIDERIERVWESHPRRFLIAPEPDFIGKAAKALDVLRGELPPCCRDHAVPSCVGHKSRVLPTAAPGVTLRLNG